MAAVTRSTGLAKAVALKPRLSSQSLSASLFLRGTPVAQAPALRLASASVPRCGPVAPRAQALAPADTPERFRLNNLAPQPGSRRKNKRKGRGHAAGQGASCGFGMRGQKSRSGPGVRPGFEGGQMPLYRRLPKLKGIAGGMGAGLPKFVNVNLNDITSLGLAEGAEVSLESLIDQGILNPSGRDRRLPLKVLGDGEIRTKLTVKAAAFSDSAREKLEAAGCVLELVPGRRKFLGAAAEKKAARAAEFFAKKDAAAA